MQNIKKIGYFILAIFICFMFLGSIKHIFVYARMTTDITKNQSIWTLVGSIILLFLLVIFSNYVEQKKENIKRIEIILWSVMVLGEFLYLIFFLLLSNQRFGRGGKWGN